MGLLSRLIGFVQDLFSGEGVVQAVQQFQEVRYRRKIVKTGKSREGNRNLFALTYEANEINRERVLVEAINAEFEVDIRSSVYGYEDFILTDRPPFVWDEIRTGKE